MLVEGPLLALRRGLVIGANDDSEVVVASTPRVRKAFFAASAIEGLLGGRFPTIVDGPSLREDATGLG